MQCLFVIQGSELPSLGRRNHPWRRSWSDGGHSKDAFISIFSILKWTTSPALCSDTWCSNTVIQITRHTRCANLHFLNHDYQCSNNRNVLRSTLLPTHVFPQHWGSNHWISCVCLSYNLRHKSNSWSFKPALILTFTVPSADTRA